MENSMESVRRLMLATTRIDEAYYKFSKQIGIKENTMAILYAIDDGKAQSQTEICENWLIPKTTINTCVHELVRDGYVELRIGEIPKEKMIFLTEKGREYTKKVLSGVYRAERIAMESTIRKYSRSFVEALEFFGTCLCKEIMKDDKTI